MQGVGIKAGCVIPWCKPPQKGWPLSRATAGQAARQEGMGNRSTTGAQLSSANTENGSDKEPVSALRGFFLFRSENNSKSMMTWSRRPEGTEKGLNSSTLVFLTSCLNNSCHRANITRALGGEWSGQCHESRMAQHHFDFLEVREEDLGHNTLHPPNTSNRKWLP